MARMILIVNATQVVTSQANPMGIKSVISGYPKDFDSKDYSDDLELTMKKAKADYYTRLGTMYADVNPARIMQTVTLEAIDGHQILHESIGYLPELTIEPEATPEVQEEPGE